MLLRRGACVDDCMHSLFKGTVLQPVHFILVLCPVTEATLETGSRKLSLAIAAKIRLLQNFAAVKYAFAAADADM